MFVEILSDQIFQIPQCNQDVHVPASVCKEEKDCFLSTKYVIVRDFLMSPSIFDPSSNHILEISYKGNNNDSVTISSYSNTIPLPEFEEYFSYKFEYLDDNMADPIEGEVTLINHQISKFTRSFPKSKGSYDSIINAINTENISSTVSEAVSNITEDIVNPIELGPNSFSVQDKTLEVNVPELDICTVEGSAITIDKEKLAAQEKFMQSINDKFKKKKINHSK